MVELRALMIGALLMAFALVALADSDSAESNTVDDSSALARAHWCRARNGSYIPLGHTYMQSTCTMCHCTTSHFIRCSMVVCMPTDCIDNSKPIVKEGQCCTQCAYDEVLTNGNVSSCVYNGITFLHGSVIKTVENKMNCWCQLGNIECRSYVIGATQGLSVFSDTTAIYIIVMVLFIILIVGSLLCCSCTLFFYYYYQKYQETLQQQYNEYVSSAGWQPMGEDEQNAGDMTAEEKRLEAEKIQGFSGIVESIPPPYADHHNSFSVGVELKQQ